jgi:hypothetical protein
MKSLNLPATSTGSSGFTDVIVFMNRCHFSRSEINYSKAVLINVPSHMNTCLAPQNIRAGSPISAGDRCSSFRWSIYTMSSQMNSIGLDALKIIHPEYWMLRLCIHFGCLLNDLCNCLASKALASLSGRATVPGAVLPSGRSSIVT